MPGKKTLNSLLDKSSVGKRKPKGGSLGRPSVYNSSYPGKLYKFLLSGNFFFQFAANIGVDRSTLYMWLNKYPDLFDARRKGEKDRNNWWFEAQAVENLKNSDFNVGLFCLLARNTHGWRTSDPREKDEVAPPVVNVFVNKSGDKDTGNDD
jgi:hypothetical protein